MRIVFDGRIYQIQVAGGINRYFAEVISGLDPDWVPTVVGVRQFGQNKPAHPNLRLRCAPDFRPRRTAAWWARHWHDPARLTKADVFHPTYYDLCSGHEISRVRMPTVITVHDMIYATYPDLMEDAASVIEHQRRAVARADRIVCVSRATETHLLELIPSAAGKTSVCHLASTFQPRAVPAPRTDQKPYFLYVGSRNGYKNFSFLLRAFAQAVKSDASIRLRVAGAPWTEAERWQLFDLGLSSRVECLVHPPEETLRELYEQAVALLYPSRHEGFGIPPLEAMACGTVVVSSNTTSLPEVIGDAGLLLAVNDADVWTDAILALARQQVNRAEWLARGARRAAEFSWEKTVRHHVAIYQSLL